MTTVASPAAIFHARAVDAHERAVAAAGAVVHHLCIGDRVVRIVFAGHELAELLVPAMAHLRAAAAHRPAGSDAALTVRVFDSESTGVPLGPPPWAPEDHGARGEIQGYNDERYRTVFAPGVDVLSCFDAERSEAVWWVPSPRVVPWWEPSFPFRPILHWWCCGGPRQPVHAGAVSAGGGAVLVTGRSGSGKTTTTLACLEAGLGYLGDDYVLVDTDEPHVWSLYDTAKIERTELYRFPGLASLVHNPDAPPEQKALLHLHAHRPHQLVRSAPIRAVVVPEVTGLEHSEVVASSPAAALTALAPTTVFHLPGAGQDTVAKLAKLVRSVPCLTLRAGTDLRGVAAAVAGVLEQAP